MPAGRGMGMMPPSMFLLLKLYLFSDAVKLVGPPSLARPPMPFPPGMAGPPGFRPPGFPPGMPFPPPPPGFGGPPPG